MKFFELCLKCSFKADGSLLILNNNYANSDTRYYHAKSPTQVIYFHYFGFVSSTVDFEGKALLPKNAGGSACQCDISYEIWKKRYKSLYILGMSTFLRISK